MFTAYIKYISLLLFSGLILTFYRATLPSAKLSGDAFKVVKNLSSAQHANFSVFKDVILPLFPALNKGNLFRGQ